MLRAVMLLRAATLLKWHTAQSVLAALADDVDDDVRRI